MDLIVIVGVIVVCVIGVVWISSLATKKEVEVAPQPAEQPIDVVVELPEVIVEEVVDVKPVAKKRKTPAKKKTAKTPKKVK